MEAADSLRVRQLRWRPGTGAILRAGGRLSRFGATRKFVGVPLCAGDGDGALFRITFCLGLNFSGEKAPRPQRFLTPHLPHLTPRAASAPAPFTTKGGLQFSAYRVLWGEFDPQPARTVSLYNDSPDAAVPGPEQPMRERPLRIPDESDDLGLPVVADNHRRLLQISSLLEHAEPGPDRPDRLCTGAAVGDARAGARPADLCQMGYIWLFSVGAFFLVRLLLDPAMVRRPMLEPNLSAGGLTFALASLLIFLLSNVIPPGLTESELEGGQRMDKLLAGEDTPEIQAYLHARGPGHPLFFIFSSFSKKQVAPKDDAVGTPGNEGCSRAVTTRATAIVAHLLLIAGIVLIGYRHFDNIHTGVAAAALYLLLPYTAEMTPRSTTSCPRSSWCGPWRRIAGRRWPECCWAWPPASSTIRCSCCRSGVRFTGGGGWCGSAWACRSRWSSAPPRC